VLELLRPYDEGDLKVEDEMDFTYSICGKGGYLLVTYWSSRLSVLHDAPPALGALRSRPLHQWVLSVGRPRTVIAGDLAIRVGEAALALARRCDGTAFDEYKFPFTSPQDLLPR
jgi:hypothetical protein